MIIKKVGVIGAGVMGVGLAQALAQTDHQVVLIDISDTILERARQDIYNNIRLSKLLKQQANLSIPEKIFENIEMTTDYHALGDIEFIIENTTEKWEIKKPVYEILDSICPKHVVFAANTSAISITKIGSATQRPERVIGMHFMNPVPMKPMVEVIRGVHTSEETILLVKEFLDRMNKHCIVVNDMPGFVSNRILMLSINEAIYLVQEQVAEAKEIDEIFRRCFGHKMGPLETADLIGLDTILFSIEVLYESFNDSKYRPCPLLKRMVDAGLHGRKSGQGFYEHQS